MPIVVVIAVLIAAYLLWDYLFYLIGVILGLACMFFGYLTYTSYQEAKISPEKWEADEQRKLEEDESYQKKSIDQKAGKGLVVAFLLITLLCGGLSYKAIEYQLAENTAIEQIVGDYSADKITNDTLKMMSDDELNKVQEVAKAAHPAFYNLKTIVNILGCLAILVGFLCAIALIPAFFMKAGCLVGAGLVASILTYCICGVIESVSEPSDVALIRAEVSSRKDAKEKEEKRVEDEKKKAEEAQKKIEEIERKINEIEDKYKPLYAEQYQKYINEGVSDDDAKDKALTDVDNKKKEDKNKEDVVAQNKGDDRKKAKKNDGKTKQVSTKEQTQVDDDSISSIIGAYASSIVEDNVYIFSHHNLDWYMIPSSKREDKHGIIFKDDGYTIAVYAVEKGAGEKGKKMGGGIVSFWETSDGWEARVDGIFDRTGWHKVKEDKNMEILLSKSKYLPNRN